MRLGDKVKRESIDRLSIRMHLDIIYWVSDFCEVLEVFLFSSFRRCSVNTWILHEVLRGG